MSATAYAADPGKVFASDIHRRVMANLPNPDDDPVSIEDLQALRIAKDDHLTVDDGELEEVLGDLEADGHAKQTKDGWRNTTSGFDVLTDKSANEAAAAAAEEESS